MIKKFIFYYIKSKATRYKIKIWEIATSNFKFYLFSKKTQRTFIDPSTLNRTDIDRLEKGKPINISEGLNVKLNSKTNRL
jgi:hypothetical protein